MTFGSKIVEGLIVTVLGIGTVMLVLFLIQASIPLLRLFNRSQPLPVSPPTSTPHSAQPQEPSAHATKATGFVLDPQLVAVITAAIASMTGTAPGMLRIATVRQVSNLWTNQGRQSLITTRQGFNDRKGN